MLTKKRSRYRKKRAAYILTGCAVLIVAAVFGAGIWKKRTASPHLKKSENSVSMDQQEDGITYKGKTYTYNDHLSNFLFMGIDKMCIRDRSQTVSVLKYLIPADRN